MAKTMIGERMITLDIGPGKRTVRILSDHDYNISAKEVAKIVGGITESGVADWRSRNYGPAFSQAGKRHTVTYQTRDVIQWYQKQYGVKVKVLENLLVSGTEQGTLEQVTAANGTTGVPGFTHQPLKEALQNCKVLGRMELVRNNVLDDMKFSDGNLPTGKEVKTELPEVAWAKLNQADCDQLRKDLKDMEDILAQTMKECDQYREENIRAKDRQMDKEAECERLKQELARQRQLNEEIDRRACDLVDERDAYRNEVVRLGVEIVALRHRLKQARGQKGFWARIFGGGE